MTAAPIQHNTIDQTMRKDITEIYRGLTTSEEDWALQIPASTSRSLGRCVHDVRGTHKLTNISSLLISCVTKTALPASALLLDLELGQTAS
jgi:hypothetical protein